MYQEPPKSRKIIWSLLLAFVGLVILTALYVFSNFGWLSVTTSPGMQLAIYNEKGEETLKPGTAFAGPIHFGEYTIRAWNDHTEAQEHVKIEWFTQKSITLTPPPVAQATPITNLALESVASAEGQLVAIDSASRALVYVNRQNQYHHTEQYAFDLISWIPGTLKGVGIAQEGSRLVVALDGSKATPVQTEATTEPASVAISRNGRLYAVYGEDLYTAASARDTLHYIATLGGGAQVLAAADNEVLVATQTAGDFAHDITTVNISGAKGVHLVKKGIESPEYYLSASISPDQTHYAIAVSGITTIYDRSLKEQSSPPTQLTGSVQWIDNSSIIYSSHNKIWRYDMKNKTATSVAYLPSYAGVLSISISASDEAYVVGSVDDQLTLYRVPTTYREVSVNQDIELLAESNMQQLYEICTINYINFMTPYIQLQTEPEDIDTCRSYIKEYLSSISVNPDMEIRVALFNAAID